MEKKSNKKKIAVFFDETTKFFSKTDDLLS